MLLCQSMYNHTTNYGDMFIWEMTAIPTVHLSRLSTQFSHPFGFANSGKQALCWKNSVNVTTWYCIINWTALRFRCISIFFFAACIWSSLLLASSCANPCENLTMWRIFCQSLREHGYGTVTGTVRQIVKRMHRWNLHGETPRWIEARMLNAAVIIILSGTNIHLSLCFQDQ